MSCFKTGGPAKEQRTNKQPPTRRVWKRSKQDITWLNTSQNPSLWHPSWLNKMYTMRKDSESEWLDKDNPETNPINIKPETTNHVTEQFSWVPFPSCSPPRCPFPIKYLALSAHVSPQTIHFQVLDKSPVSGPGRGPPSCNNTPQGWWFQHWLHVFTSYKSFCWVGVSHSYSCDSGNIIPPIASLDPMMHCRSLLVLLTMTTLNHLFFWLSSINPLDLPFLFCQK